MEVPQLLRPAVRDNGGDLHGLSSSVAEVNIGWIVFID